MNKMRLRKLQKNENAVRRKLAAGWNAFTREEVETLLGSLQMSREATARHRYRLNAAFPIPYGWHDEDGTFALYPEEKPDTARNVFVKPPCVHFEAGWRLQKGESVRGFGRDANGMLMAHRPKPRSPNDVLRHAQNTIDQLRQIKKARNDIQSEPAEHPDN